MRPGTFGFWVVTRLSTKVLVQCFAMVATRPGLSPSHEPPLVEFLIKSPTSQFIFDWFQALKMLVPHARQIFQIAVIISAASIDDIKTAV